jgi:hypothetical protein
MRFYLKTLHSEQIRNTRNTNTYLSITQQIRCHFGVTVIRGGGSLHLKLITVSRR